MNFSKLLNYATYLSFSWALFFLPLKTSLSNFGLILCLLTTVISFIYRGLDLRPLKSKSFYLLTPLAFFIPVLIGLSYTPLIGEGLEEVRKMIFFLVFPLLILRRDLRVKRLKKWGGYALITGALLSAVILLSVNVFRLSHEELSLHVIFSSDYTNFAFLRPLKRMHPIYLGTYFVMALTLILNKAVALNKYIRVLGSVILLVAIVFLNSRIAYFSTLLIAVLFAVDKLSWKTSVLLFAGFAAVVVLSLPHLKNTYIYNKLVNGTLWDLQQNIGTHNTDTTTTSDSRMSRWIVGWELFGEKPLIGYGTGTENERLLEKYKEKGMQRSVKNEYNAHNQFLAFLIRYGCIGAVFVLLFLTGNLYLAFVKKDIVFLGYLAIITSVFLVENYIDRNMGVNFTVVFGTLFYLKNFESKPSLKSSYGVR